MLLYVYAAVIVLCLITFRSWRAVVVAVVPLALTSILCEALMVVLGIGVKVATLPVIALGVGIGVDYALYLLSVQLAQQRAGLPLTEAYKNAVQFTGKVVALVGVTLAAGVDHLGVLADQVPGRHGHPAHVHVPLEHARRAGADSRALLLPAADVDRPAAAQLSATNEAIMALDRLHDDDARRSSRDAKSAFPAGSSSTSKRIDEFADCTGDRQWIHVDVERARRESPYGGTIAHGYLTLSLAASLSIEAGVIPSDAAAALNYGLDKVRFIAPVKAGARVRNRVVLVAVEDKGGWARSCSRCATRSRSTARRSPR